MSEPISTGAATAAVTSVTFIGLLSGIDAGAMVGAFAGSVLFVVSATDLTWRIKGLLFVVSMIAGILGADFVASIITSITPESVMAARPLGAIVASAVAVRLLMFISNQAGNPTGLIDRLRGPK
ncbi:putative holin [Serratia sp. DD3]|uniref:putative holin n=1 Tax=Serratia sp. DD3 TaxID=1410619 RepID=UPI0003C51095|nr:putative holin [Serratia sp. DD3]KEY56947.1 hypothetical protein SRDD_41960 [Serratia sp. DD3]